MITIKNYKMAESLEEAWELNQKRNNRILGGMLWLKMGRGAVGTAIDLSGLGLDRIEEDKHSLRIGSMVSLRQLELHPGLGRYSGGAVKEALRHIVGVQFRNLATVGGSVYGRYGFSDVLTMLLAFDSYVELYKGGLTPLREYAAGPYDRDVITGIVVKKTPASFAYHSVRNTKTDFPVLTCAAALPGEAGAQEGLSCARAAIGARPGRAVLTEDREGILKGRITEEKAAAFGEYVSKQVPTGSNLRGSAQYRSHLVRVLVKRAVLELGGIPEC